MKLTFDFEKKQITVQGELSITEVYQKCFSILGDDLKNWTFVTTQNIQVIKEIVKEHGFGFQKRTKEIIPYWSESHPLKVTCVHENNPLNGLGLKIAELITNLNNV